MTAKQNKVAEEYLASFVPEKTDKFKKAKGSSQGNEKIKSIEDEISRISDELVKQNRDQLDAMYNIDMDNLGEGMRSLIAKTQNSIASIQAQADENSASIGLITKWQSKTNKSLAALNLKVDANSSSIELLSQWKNETTTSIAQIQAQTSQNSSSIDLLTQWQGETNTTIANLNLVVSENSSSIELLSQWKGETSTSITQIKEQANENSASIGLLTQWQGEVETSISTIQTQASQNTASIELLTQWKNDATTSIAQIQAQTSQNSSSIDLLTQWQGETNTAIAQVEAKANQNAADIQAFAEWRDGTGSNSLAGVIANATSDFATVGMISSVTDSYGDITAASIVAAVNESGSKVTINADKVDLNGYVTISSLEDGEGTTEINNCNIVLKSTQYCDSISSIKFLKERDGAPERWDPFAEIYTIDRGSDGTTEGDRSRFALTITTDFFKVDGTNYDAALRLVGEGNAALESRYGMVYIAASTREDYSDILMTANRGVIRMQPAFYGGDVSLNSGEITFCSDGIYYGKHLVLAF